jgi:hypothetical protein
MDMITRHLELIFGEDDMKIVSIHVGILTYIAAVNRNVRYKIVWHQLQQNYSYPCMYCTCLLLLQIKV